MKYAWIEEHRDRFSISRMCRLLEVSRSGYCQWRTREPSERGKANMALDVRVAAIHTASRRSYGRHRIAHQLRHQGLRIGHERVRRSLVRQGLRPVYRRAYPVTTDSNHPQPVAPNLLERRISGWQVNQVWVSDITYIATAQRWLYLAVVMDLASRRIVGWSMSDRMLAPLVCQALQAAHGRRQPGPGLILHSDRGSQYASASYRRLIERFGMRQSMSRKGNCWDNAAMESFFKSLKVERVGQLCYATRAQARLDIVDWIEGFYNRERLHSSIGYRTPASVESTQNAG